eukprot:m.17408 g.17408  ORF g.17408 m.17408 type:complete len:87 (-) comp9294_c0_seq2:545-805(-)
MSVEDHPKVVNTAVEVTVTHTQVLEADDNKELSPKMDTSFHTNPRLARVLTRLFGPVQRPMIKSMSLLALLFSVPLPDPYFHLRLQ